MKIKKLIKDDQEFEEQGPGQSDFEKMLNQSTDDSSKKLKKGDRIEAELLSLGKEYAIVSTGTRFDGFVPIEQLTRNDGSHSVSTGDTLTLYVTHIKGPEIHLSVSVSGQKIAEDIQEAFKNELPIEGHVTETNKGGYQVTIKGHRAFCPISQMDSKHIENPEDFVGKKLEFQITQFEDNGQNIVVSRRRVLDKHHNQALSNLQEQKNVGDLVKGKVTRLENYGAFIEIAPGIEGMAHISELSWSRVKTPSDLLEIGQIVSAKILKIEHESNKTKIALSIKQVEESPWAKLPTNIRTGNVVAGKVTRCVNFGAFVELSPGIEGLIPLSQLSSAKRANNAEEFVSPGQEISVMVKEVLPGEKRISLSLKDALNQASSLSEAEDIKYFKAMQKKQQSQEAPGDLAQKLQEALKNKKS